MTYLVVIQGKQGERRVERVEAASMELARIYAMWCGEDDARIVHIQEARS